MIKLCTDDTYFLRICDKLNLPRLSKINLTKDRLYFIMVGSLITKDSFTYISIDDDNQLNGCIILAVIQNILGDKVLSLVFTWIDSHYPDLYKEFIDITTKMAQELKADKLCFQTNRNEKVIQRKMGKYGFNKAFSVYEKKIKDVI
jgi:hypothetical protein